MTFSDSGFSRFNRKFCGRFRLKSSGFSRLNRQICGRLVRFSPVPASSLFGAPPRSKRLPRKHLDSCLACTDMVCVMQIRWLKKYFFPVHVGPNFRKKGYIAQISYLRSGIMRGWSTNAILESC